MNMTIGCREHIDSSWIYHLMDGTKMSQEKWTSIVKKHIAETGNDEAYEKIIETIKLWNRQEKIEDVALIVYASKYCQNVHVDMKEHTSLKLKQVKDDMGCNQLSFC